MSGAVKKERSEKQLAADRVRSIKMREKHALGLMPKRKPNAYIGYDQCGNAGYYDAKHKRICNSNLHKYILSNDHFTYVDKVPGKSRKANKNKPVPLIPEARPPPLPPPPTKAFNPRPKKKYSINGSKPTGGRLLNSGGSTVLASPAPVGRVVYSAAASTNRNARPRKRTVTRTRTVTRGGAVY